MLASEGDILKAQGMALALASKNNPKKEEWKEKATKLLIAYAKAHKLFMAEDAWTWAFDQGLPQPESPNIRGALWKAVMLKKDAALVMSVGMSKAKTAKSHSHPFPMYLSKICPLTEGTGATFSESLAKLKHGLTFKKITLDEYNEEFATLILQNANMAGHFNPDT